ncbi:MAG TPA: sulfite exporter TauE/SafE family protein [Kiritimatiellia bacterium]|nr:sulfite exporter TauE/SafE family protein [Kiritimatiellia bacterium]
MNGVILQALLAGLSTGVFCTAYCLPFIAPYMAAEGRSLKESAGVIGRFLGGRLTGYVLFGALFGYLGERLHGAVLSVILSVALVAMAVLLMLHGLGLLQHRWKCCSQRLDRRTPFLMGLLMGVNVCPPFMLSLAYVATLQSVLNSILYFVVFFIGTSVYALPLVFVGLLGRMPEFRRAAQISAVAVGFLFAAYGLYSLGAGGLHPHGP